MSLGFGVNVEDVSDGRLKGRGKYFRKKKSINIARLEFATAGFVPWSSQSRRRGAAAVQNFKLVSDGLKNCC